MNRLQMLCRRALCVPIRIYQYTLSPWIGRSCRFSPSCSNYTMQAILTHGCIKGILLGAWRIARCNPLGKWGVLRKPFCRVATTTIFSKPCCSAQFSAMGQEQPPSR